METKLTKEFSIKSELIDLENEIIKFDNVDIKDGIIYFYFIIDGELIHLIQGKNEISTNSKIVLSDIGIQPKFNEFTFIEKDLNEFKISVKIKGNESIEDLPCPETIKNEDLKENDKITKGDPNEVYLQFTMKRQNIDQLGQFLFQKEEVINEKITDINILDKIKAFNKKYSKFKNINRFCVPIFGKCNSGKSTFLNYILHQKQILEVKGEISTKFICIIRHDPNLSSPRIYKVKFEERDTLFFNDENNNKTSKEVFNFIEDEEIEGNIEEIIKEKNKELKNESKDIKDYFLIMKINIPLFNEPELAPYSNCFEFMDIPGLNETNDTDKEGFYLKKLFPYFIYNVKFCFFIFDAEEYHSQDYTKIFNNLLSLFEDEDNISKNSIFIFNKIDKPENKELAIQNFETYVKNTLKINEIDYIACSSKLLLLNSFKFKNYLNYMEYIFNDTPSGNNIDPNEHIRTKLEEDFGEEVEENLDDKEDFNELQENEYKKFNEKIENLTSFSSKLSKSDYFYYKQFFKKNEKNSATKEIELKLKKRIFNTCKTIIDCYIDFDEFKNLMEEILPKLGIETEKIEDIKFNLKKRQIVSLKNDPIIIFDSLKEIIEKIGTLKKHEFIEKISDECSFFEKFIKKEIKIRIPTLGCYSSGKSSLINNLIGYDIMPVNSEVSTNIGIVINYTNSIENICLKKTFLNKSENYIEDYYYFSDSDTPIYSKLYNMKEILSLMNNAYI